MSLFSLGTALGALLISAVGGWGAVVLVLSWARVPDLPADRISSPDGRPAAVLGSSAPSSFTVIRGGTWIGALERVATTGALLFGQPALVAVVVAVRGWGAGRSCATIRASTSGSSSARRPRSSGPVPAGSWAGCCWNGSYGSDANPAPDRARCAGFREALALQDEGVGRAVV